MDEATFKNRTKQYGIRAIRLALELPHSREVNVLVRQLVSSATSVGANYRSACRAKSKPDMVSKMSISEEECDESLYWLELIEEVCPAKKNELRALLKEGDELTAMLVSSIKTLKNSPDFKRGMVRERRRSYADLLLNED